MYSLRQVVNTPPPGHPSFGGLVIGRVDATAGAGSGVYFGEWAPQRAGLNDAQLEVDTTDLNMTNSARAVFYVGDNPVTTTPTTLSNVTYAVVGIGQTGENGHLPHQASSYYAGTLTANYNAGAGSITGTINRGSDSRDFAGTDINSNGTFGNTSKTIKGQFYNNADALAGYHLGSGAADAVSFGGKKTGGTITP